MDRQTVYFGQLARETDLLLAEQNAMVALAKLSGAVLGLTTIVNGFTCTPTGPATLNVLLTPGEIYQLENIEQSAWSSLGTNTNTILKQGIIQANAQLAITPPGTVGFSQVYLIEVEYQDLDTGSVVLPYYNAANPALPFSGPGNSGSAQNTVRQGIVAIQAKAGIAATTGTQVAPTADAGWTGLFTVTVANGQSTITSGNINQVASAPFIPATLPAIPADVQANKWTYATDTGTTNAVVIALNPAPTSYQTGDIFFAKIANSNNGASTLNVNGLGSVSIVHANDSSSLNQFDLNAGAIAAFAYDGTHFQLAWSQRQPGNPIYLQSAQTYYVNASTGSDTLYDGLSATVSGAHGPFATIQKAANVSALFNLNGFNITINVAAGNYAPVSFPSITGAGFVFLTGAGIGSSVIGTLGVSTTAIKLLAGSFNISGFLLQASGAIVGNDPVCGIAASGGQTSVTLTSMAWGVCSGCHIAATNGALINYGGAHTINGGCAGNAQVPGAHIFAYSGGAVQNISGNAPAITIASAVTFASAFVYAQILGIIQVIYASLTNPSNATGGRYIVASNAIINTAGGGASYFPGTIAGTALTGGQYF